MTKLKMLKPRLPTLNPFEAKGYKMLKYPPKPTLRWTKDSNGRTLALDSRAWRKLRRTVLMAEPLCRMCTSQGKTVPATDVDHRDNNPANNELVNLQPLCHECHSLKTNRDMGHNVRMGCDTDGKPLDPYHHWNEGVRADLMRQESPATEPCQPAGSPSSNANCQFVV